MMETNKREGGLLMFEQIEQVVEEIVKAVGPEKVILISRKLSLSGEELGSFKLCVVLEDGDKEAAERKIYTTVDSDIPFDVVIYHRADFENYAQMLGAFAWKIANTGRVLYEKRR